MSHLLGVDDLKPLLHLATLVAPALLVGHQGDVGMLRDALLAVTAVHAAAVLVVTQVVVTARQRDERFTRPHTQTHTCSAEGGGTGSRAAVSPLGELQVGCVVNNSWGFSIQCFSLQAKTTWKQEINDSAISICTDD